MSIFPDATLLAATILVEGVVVLALAKNAGVAATRLLIASIAINIATQPAFSAWLKAVSYGQDYKWPMFFAAGEIAVIFAETALYFLALRNYGATLKSCAVISAAANITSLTVGLLLPL